MTEKIVEDNNIVTAKFLVKALRDNGYRNAATALAELADNSIQAGATSLELLFAENPIGKARGISKIAVLDNGKGMTSIELRQALRFGVGTHHEDANGMGKFGMGLPSASISQCRKVEVWSWKKDHKVASYTYLDLDEVEAGAIDVPAPIVQKVPKLWREAALRIGASGTLVVWSNIDKCIWKTAKALIDNSENLIGRIYRKFIEAGTVKIRLAAFSELTPTIKTRDSLALANDPGYLMAVTSTPPPFDKNPMFEPDGDTGLETVKFYVDGVPHDVSVRFSLAKLEARSDRRAAGKEPSGKHAGKNIGVSVVRAERELNLDQSFVIGYDPAERWWGVEINFPPALDEIFGVTNNKQEARNLSEVFAAIDQEGKQGASIDEDWRAGLFELVNLVNRRLGTMRKAMKAQGANRTDGGGRQRHNRAEELATIAQKRLLNAGELIETANDKEASELSPEERKTQIALVLEGVGAPPDVAHLLAHDAVILERRFTIVSGQLDGSAFFSVTSKAGDIIVTLNLEHVAYRHLLAVLELPEDSNENVKELTERLERASTGLRILLLAWARFEDEKIGDAKTQVKEFRHDWGRFARMFLEELGDS